MTNRNKHWFKGVIALGALVISSALRLFSGSLTDSKITVLRILPIPIALVGGNAVFANDYAEAQSMGKKINISDPQVIYNYLLENKKLAVLADSLKINSKAEEDPKTLLQFYYNSQKNLNLNTYTRAENMVGRVNGGESFESLAKTYSEDDFSKTFGGNIGVVEPKDLLPEVASQIEPMRVGEIKIIPSRLGLHMVKLNKKDSSQFELQQIFFTTTGFETWLNNSLKEIETKIILKP